MSETPFDLKRMEFPDPDCRLPDNAVLFVDQYGEPTLLLYNLALPGAADSAE